MRLDKFLKVSRIIKRRTVANEACDRGRVMIGGKVAKPSSEVKPGDELDILLGGTHVRVRVLSTQEHALKADATGMYEMLGGAQ
ncbi:MAG: RNA-binding S4 domain-containing protein [Christensenellaceae bacterium]|nr:RNA-binding S4 domain-containing protein [Christensenellaceae bacterium]